MEQTQSTSTPANPLSFWFGGYYFTENPKKILGPIVTVSGPFGPEQQVKGDISSLDLIAVPQAYEYEYVIDNFDAQNLPAIDVEKVKKSIRKTKETPKSVPRTSGIEMLSFSDVQERYNSSISTEGMKAWVYYQSGKLFNKSIITNQHNGWSQYIVPQDELASSISSWISMGLVAYDGNDYVPSVLYYAGNIYEKIKVAKSNESKIVKTIGQEAFDEQLLKLNQCIPAPLQILAPANERLYLSLVDPFIKTIFIERFADGTLLDDNRNLQQAFLIWADQLPEEDYKNGSSRSDIQNYYIGSSRFSKSVTAEEKILRTRNAQIDGQLLFSRFLYEGIGREDQQKIEYLWNTTLNAFKEYEFDKIPVGLVINKYFKTSLIDPRKVLWDGVRYLGANGSGIVAFDVGVGKTMCAILAMGQAMYTGQCKRPLVVVPNPTYAKWISETVGDFDKDGNCLVHGVLPQYANKVNDYNNLGVAHEHKIKQSPPQDGTITFVTYKGLMKLGLSGNVSDKIGNEIFSILNQGDLGDREISSLKEKVQGMIGSANSETIANFDELGFDYIVIDEAHNFKKIFTKVKGHGDSDDKNHYAISSGEPSLQGLKAFILCQQVLRNNNMRNVVLLTATPFTNSPLEVYSMLSLVAYQTLERKGIANLTDFFDKFINETVEDGVTASGIIKPLPVIKNFNNKILLQNIIFSSIIFRTGEEANVKRPIKIVYPYLKDSSGKYLLKNERVETYLPQTDIQKYWLKEVSKLANEESNAIEPLLSADYYEDKKLKGRVLLAINLAQSITLSPYLFEVRGKGGTKVNPAMDDEADYVSFVETSPKFMYTMECVRSVRNYHISKGEEVSGQVIYSNRGKDYFPLIKDYLVKKIGYDEKEVEIIIGDMNANKKERIKTKFLAGEIKIIIGSSTIKEGIDLQNKSTCLYNCNLDWNPTDIQQLEGRIWRQNNQHTHVRIVTPLVENSVDIFMFQKLEEKTSRINDIWSRNGRSNVLDVDTFDPEELKHGLMTDPIQRALSQIRNERQTIERNTRLVEGYITQLNSAHQSISNALTYKANIESNYKDAIAWLIATQKQLIEELPSLTKKPEIEAQNKRIERITELLGEPTDKLVYAAIKRYAKAKIAENSGNSYFGNYGNSRYWDMISNVDAQIRVTKELEAIEKNLLSRRNLKVTDDLSPIITEYRNEIADKRNELDYVNSNEYQQILVDRFLDEQAIADGNSKSIESRVAEFEKHNHLLSCIEKTHACDINGIIKKIEHKPEMKVVKSKNKTEEVTPQEGNAIDIELQLAEAEAEAIEIELLLLAA